MAIRMTISVPDDLKRRMDKVRAPVNWSALAQQAFERKLGELVSLKKEKTMKDVVQRLRASQLASASESRTEGIEAGKSWASIAADAAALRRLRDARVGCGNDWVTIFVNGDPRNVLYSYISDTETKDVNQQDCDAFWYEMSSDDWVEFVLGFADGAIQVWESVEGEL